MGGLVAAYKKRPVKQPVFDGIQVLIGYSSVQVPSTMNRPSDRLISRPTISPGVCRAAYRMSVLFLPCAFSVSFFSASIAARFYWWEKHMFLMFCIAILHIYCFVRKQRKSAENLRFLHFESTNIWLALAELRCTTCSLQTVLREFLSCFPLILRAFPAFCLSVIRCADHKKRPFFIQQ